MMIMMTKLRDLIDSWNRVVDPGDMSENTADHVRRVRIQSRDQDQFHRLHHVRAPVHASLPAQDVILHPDIFEEKSHVLVHHTDIIRHHPIATIVDRILIQNMKNGLY